MIQFREDSQAVLILKYICLCGELPWRSLYLLPVNTVTLRRTIKGMRNESYLTVVGKGDLKTIRMTKKAFPVIKDLYPALLDYYLSITDNHHFRGGSYKNNDVGARQTWRRHRMAEVLCILGEENCALLPFEKPILLTEKKQEPNIKEGKRYFYSSRELKNTDPAQKFKTDFTRMLGLYISPGGTYCVYNTNKRLMKWNTQGEGKAQVLVEDILRINYEPLIGKNFQVKNALLFAENMDMAYRLLEYNDSDIRENSNFEFLSFNNIYDNIYYVPLNNDGIEQLDMISLFSWKNNLSKIVFGKDYKKDMFGVVDCDKYDKENNTFILLFFDGNIARLQRFKHSAELSKDSVFNIFCFPWQVDLLSKYFKDLSSITFSVFTIEEIMSRIKL